jgi:hypothetical protein
VDMKPVIIGQVVFGGEIDPLFGPLGAVGSVVHANAVTVVHDSAAVSLRNVITD